MKKHGKPIFGWHFLAYDANGPLLRDRTRPPKAGEILRVEGGIIPCAHGLHASVDPLDACGYARGAYVTRVKLTGTIVEHGGDKHAASERTIIYGFDASRTLRLFACWCVRNTKLPDGRTTWDLLTDKRSREAVEVAERYAVGDATEDELDVARAAANDVAWAAARDAARDAASDAASKQLAKMLEEEAKRLGVYRNEADYE